MSDFLQMHEGHTPPHASSSPILRCVFFGSGEPGVNRCSHIETMKIILQIKKVCDITMAFASGLFEAGRAGT